MKMTAVESQVLGRQIWEKKCEACAFRKFEGKAFGIPVWGCYKGLYWPKRGKCKGFVLESDMPEHDIRERARRITDRARNEGPIAAYLRGDRVLTKKIAVESDYPPYDEMIAVYHQGVTKSQVVEDLEFALQEKA